MGVKIAKGARAAIAVYKDATQTAFEAFASLGKLARHCENKAHQMKKMDESHKTECNPDPLLLESLVPSGVFTFFAFISLKCLVVIIEEDNFYGSIEALLCKV